MKVKKTIHRVYAEWINSGKSFRQLFGKYHYIYSSDKGEISLVRCINYFLDGKDLWEIYCLEGNLFEDVERFDTKKEAEVTIRKYLEPAKGE